MLLFIYLFGIEFSSDQTNAVNHYFKTISPGQLFIACFAAAVIPLFLVLCGSHGSFPFRMLNIECLVLMGVLATLCLYFGRNSNNLNRIEAVNASLFFIKRHFYEIFIVLIIASPFSYDLFQTMIAGYNYHKANEIEISNFKNAHSHQLNLPFGKDSIRKRIILNSPLLYNRKVIQEIGEQKPKLIYFKPAEPDNSFQYKMEYFHLDTVKIGQNLFTNNLKK